MCYHVDSMMIIPVHLRIREVDQLIPKSLYPSTSANTYWQIEAEASILYGEHHLFCLTSSPCPIKLCLTSGDYHDPFSMFIDLLQNHIQ